MLIRIFELIVFCVKAIIILLFFMSYQTAVLAENECDPIVQINGKHSMLSEALVFLAEEHGFLLSLPKSVDRPINVNESMPLEKMVKYLTRDLNTLMKHDESNSCSGKKLTELIIVPTGDDTEFINVHATAAQERAKEYLYIEDMDAYARDVKAGKRKANKHLMTPEQRVEFKYSKRKLQRRE